MLVDGNTLSFHYDADGKPMSFVYNGTTYYYTTNLQGDIVAILSKEGTQVVAYSYDAWGNILSITGTKADTIGKYNPLRYRGYVYDTESKLYYLQSRYYDPYVGRFINADSFATTGQGLLGNNMFAYCGNNPVANMDQCGCRYISATRVENETTEERSIACQFQNRITQSFYSGANENNENLVANPAATLTLGLSGSIGVGPWAWGGQASFTVDSSSYIALQYGYSGGISADAAPFGFSYSLALFL